MSDHPFSLDLFDDPSSSEADNRQVAFTDLRAAQLLSLLKSKKLDPVLTATKVGATLVRYTLTLKRSLGKKALRDLEDELALLLLCGNVWLYQGEKNTLYVETPRENPNFFSLRGLLEEPSFQKASSPLTFAVGRDFEGHPILGPCKASPPAHRRQRWVGQKHRTPYAFALPALQIHPRAVEFTAHRPLCGGASRL